MKKFMFFALLVVLAGAISFVAYSFFEKKEEVKVTRNYSGDLAVNMDVVIKRINQKDIYLELDPEPKVNKISNTEIANFINSSLPLNPWLMNPDTLKCGDTITWNCQARGFENNPRVGVTDGHTMWLMGRELLQFMHGVSRSSETSVVSDSESVDLTKAELKEQQRLDSLSSLNQSGIGKNIPDEKDLYFIRAFFLAILFSSFVVALNHWSYRFDHKTLLRKMP